VLHIEQFVIDTIAEIEPLVRRIAQHDADLGRQMRRAAASIALNVSEGRFSRGKNEMARFQTALGSANETLACLKVGVAFKYIATPDPKLLDRFGRIVGTLHKLSQPRR